MSALIVLAVLIAVALCSFSSLAQSDTPAPVSGLLDLGSRFDFTAASAALVSGDAAFQLHCNPPLSFTNLPDAGAPLTAFQTYVDLSLTTVTAVIRFALYSVDDSSTYTLVAGTDTSSDVQVSPAAVSGQTVLSTTSPLFYPSGASYTVLPYQSYALCLASNGGAQYIPGSTTNGTVAIYGWTEGYSGTSNIVFAPYSISQPLPSPLQSTGTSSNTYAVWMAVTAPVVTYSFVYGLQGSFDGSSATDFRVCAVGTFLVNPTVDAVSGGYPVWQMYGTRTFTNGSERVTNNIVGLAPLYTYGSTNLLYPHAYPFVDVEGVSFELDGNAILPGGYIEEYYLTGPNPTVIIYATGDGTGDGTTGGVLFERGYNVDVADGGYTNQTGVGIVLSPPNSDLVYSCAVLDGAAPRAPGAPGGGSSSSSGTARTAHSSSASAASATPRSSTAVTAARSSSSGSMSSAALSSSPSARTATASSSSAVGRPSSATASSSSSAVPIISPSAAVTVSSSSAATAASSTSAASSSSTASSFSSFSSSVVVTSSSSAALSAPSSSSASGSLASSSDAATAQSSSCFSSVFATPSSSASSSPAPAGAATSASASSTAAAEPSTAGSSSSTGGAIAAPSSTAAASSSPVVLAPTSSLNPTSVVSPSSVSAPSSVSGVVTLVASSTAGVSGGATGGGSRILTSEASSVRGGVVAVALILAVVVLLAWERRCPSSTAAAASSSPAVPSPTSAASPTSTVSPSSVIAPSSISSVVTPLPSSAAGGASGGGNTLLTSAASRCAAIWRR
ncbi:hypothetical protein MMC34_008429 [Xylographa carneopallida]|nr:hypothetical protein [Xylographa carneopallida]